MATVVTSSIGTSGRDYSTLQAWEDACPANLVTADQVWKGECYNDSEFLGSATTQITFNGVTTDATRFIWLTAAAGQSFADHADKLTNPLKYDQSKGVGLRLTGNYGTHIVNSGVFKVVVDRLQFFYDSTYNSNYYPPISWSGGGIFRDCVIESRRTSNRIWQTISSLGGAPIDVVNVVVIDRGSAGCIAFADFGPLGVFTRFTNCTALRPTDLATGGTGFYGSASYSQTIVNNCAVVGAFANGTVDTFNTGASGNNATTVGTMPGSGSLSGLTASDLLVGVISSGVDARAKAGGDLIGAASVQSAYTNDLDIVGQARSGTAPTIGAWEYLPPPPVAPTLSAPGVDTITSTSAIPKVTLDFA